MWDYFILFETIPWHGDFFMVNFCHFEKSSLEKNIMSKILWFEFFLLRVDASYSGSISTKITLPASPYKIL